MTKKAIDARMTCREEKKAPDARKRNRERKKERMGGYDY